MSILFQQTKISKTHSEEQSLIDAKVHISFCFKEAPQEAPINIVHDVSTPMIVGESSRDTRKRIRAQAHSELNEYFSGNDESAPNMFLEAIANTEADNIAAFKSSDQPEKEADAGFNPAA